MLFFNYLLFLFSLNIDYFIYIKFIIDDHTNHANFRNFFKKIFNNQHDLIDYNLEYDLSTHLNYLIINDYYM
jgi:hypothetical protein